MKTGRIEFNADYKPVPCPRCRTGDAQGNPLCYDCAVEVGWTPVESPPSPIERAIDAELDLAPIEAREQAATNGPWFVREGRDPDDWDVGSVEGAMNVAQMVWSYDAPFIAHARTDIPALVAEVKRLKVENEKLRNGLDEEGLSLSERCCGEIKGQLAAENERLRAEVKSLRRELRRVRLDV